MKETHEEKWVRNHELAALSLPAVVWSLADLQLLQLVRQVELLLLQILITRLMMTLLASHLSAMLLAEKLDRKNKREERGVSVDQRY